MKTNTIKKSRSAATTASAKKRSTKGPAAATPKSKPVKRAPQIVPAAAVASGGGGLTPSTIAAAGAILKQVRTALSLTPSNLTTPQIRTLTKLPKGGEAIVAELIAVSTSSGVEAPTVATTDLATLLAEVTTLNVFETQLKLLVKDVSDYALQRREACWQDALLLYGILQKVGGKVPSIPGELAPVVAFLSRSVVTKRATARAAAKASKATSTGTPSGTPHVPPPVAVAPPAAATAVTVPPVATPPAVPGLQVVARLAS